MAVGVPVACSNVTSLPEVAKDAAIMFDPRIPEQIAQATISLTQDTALRARLIEAGIARAAQFSDSRIMAQQYLDIFQKAVGRPQSNILSGNYLDGWVGTNLKLRFVPSVQPRTVAVRMSLPEWVPVPHVTLRISHPSGTSSEHVCFRGRHSSISLPLGFAGGDYDMSLSPSFVPALAGLSEDQRELCAILLECTVSSANGEHISLFPETFPR
jgi:hypothetical protein